MVDGGSKSKVGVMERVGMAGKVGMGGWVDGLEMMGESIMGCLG